MTKLLEENQASGKVRELYDEIRSAMGLVPNFFKAQAAVDPEWAALNWQRTRHIMVETHSLDRKTKELIALAVSLRNRCEYCSAAHEMLARMSGATDEEIDETKRILELFMSFNAIADSLKVPLDEALR